jgi:hypothetical protein
MGVMQIETRNLKLGTTTSWGGFDVKSMKFFAGTTDPIDTTVWDARFRVEPPRQAAAKMTASKRSSPT